MSSGRFSGTASPEEAVERQFDAYNRQALEEFLACFADSVELLVDGVTAASGKEALREIYGRQFAQAPVKATSLARLRQGEWIVDHERIDGPALPSMSVLALYRVRDGLIDQVQFLGQQVEA
ncbi:nuclear transport factor 2 family protein [Streptomyces afghaniensis]|uniref:nuclear transport factor 2 family protein n=1 Tax=Streptomyces afghaniensis TaxID=66865 RepID=UPI002782A655|nr:nuclear transport factor 2 family protein [Streptomyces afghaniensis]MDQ1018106.1 hypothetical protein [Streptomyces afghaniensis]